MAAEAAALLAAPAVAVYLLDGTAPTPVGSAGRLPLTPVDAAGGLIGLAAATAIEGARAHRSATALALTDALTGLGNRRRLAPRARPRSSAAPPRRGRTGRRATTIWPAPARPTGRGPWAW